jgi:hypothetical protein
MEGERTVPEADEAAIEEVQGWAAGLGELHAQIAGRFVRAEPRRRVLAYLRGLLGNLGRKNGSSVVKEAAFGQVVAVWFDRCWSATRQRYTTSDSRRFRHRSASLGDLPSAILRR